jgi:hypothetical protein
MSPTSVLLHRAKPRLTMAALWTVLTCAFALCNRTAGAAPADPSAGTPAGAALRVDRDPVTGTLTPAGPSADPMLLPLWSANMRPALDRLSAVMMADGSVMVDLTGIYLDFATAHREWDGRLVTGCDDTWMPGVLQPLAVPRSAALGWAEK